MLKKEEVLKDMLFLLVATLFVASISSIVFFGYGSGSEDTTHTNCAKINN